jgi:hypothetical protein
LNNFAPANVKIKYRITLLLNSKGNKQTGVYEMRKFLKTTKLRLEKQNVLFCMDSDANYLLKDSLTQNKLYILQTYSYSIENLKSIPENLNKIVLKYGIDFDFVVFLSQYSKIIYDFFLYWLAVKKAAFPLQEALASTHFSKVSLKK